MGEPVGGRGNWKGFASLPTEPALLLFFLWVGGLLGIRARGRAGSLGDVALTFSV